jgi:hypothetical protein
MKERFEKYVMPVPWSGCHIWIGGCFGNGIPAFSVNNRPIQAYKVAYEIYKGPVGNQHVCHTCDNPVCVNPAHLFLGTPKINAMDRQTKGRGVVPSAKLTWDQIQSIRSDDRLHYEIARDYGVSRAKITDIKNHKTYKSPSACRNYPLSNWERFSEELGRTNVTTIELPGEETVQ